MIPHNSLSDEAVFSTGYFSGEHRILWIGDFFFFQLRIGSRWKLFQDCALILIADLEDGDPLKGPSRT